MSHHLKILFVIADGGHARWVERSDHADDFVTMKEMKAEPRPHGGPGGVVFEGGSGQRFSVEERHGAVQHHHEEFAQAVAKAINAEAVAGAFQRLGLVAPAKTLDAIRHHLSKSADALVVATLAKDLAKTPDHELGGWLRHLELI